MPSKEEEIGAIAQRMGVERFPFLKNRPQLASPVDEVNRDQRHCQIGYEACAKLFLPHIIALVGRAKHGINCNRLWAKPDIDSDVCDCGLSAELQAINDLLKP